MTEEKIFNAEAEVWRLMKERFDLDGVLVFKLGRHDALALLASMKRQQKLSNLAKSQTIHSAIAYWGLATIDLAGALRRYIFSPNAARVREFCLVHSNVIRTIEYEPCADQPKHMLVRVHGI